MLSLEGQKAWLGFWVWPLSQPLVEQHMVSFPGLTFRAFSIAIHVVIISFELRLGPTFHETVALGAYGLSPQIEGLGGVGLKPYTFETAL